MVYKNVLSNLYCEDLSCILKVLNNSIYVSEYTSEKDEIVIHTGFVFKTHRVRKMEILYEIQSQKIIRQVRLDGWSMPYINGLSISRNNETYYNYISGNIIEALSKNNKKLVVKKIKDPADMLRNKTLDKIKVCEFDTNEESLVTNFSIYNKSMKKIINKFPLNKELDAIIFFDGSTFQKYISDEDFYNDNEDYDYIDDPYPESYGRYSGTWAQDEAGLSDEFIDDVLDGNPDAYWNID